MMKSVFGFVIVFSLQSFAGSNNPCASKSNGDIKAPVAHEGLLPSQEPPSTTPSSGEGVDQSKQKN